MTSTLPPEAKRGPDLLVKPMVACLIAEVIGNSPTSFHDAIEDAVGRLLGTAVHGVDVLAQKISFGDDGSRNYRVVLKVAYDGRLN